MVTAKELLTTYEIRKEGYEVGLMKYGARLYAAICILVERLAQLPADEQVRIDIRDGEAVFVVAKTGVEIARLPTAAAPKG